MIDGWVKLHRQIINWEWFGDSDTFKLFIYLILSASHKDTKFKGIDILRGQLLTGRRKISDDTHISQQSIKTILKRLKSTSEITIKSTNKYSIITICKYNDYQLPENEINQQINQPARQRATSNQPATNHIQEYKNVKKVKKTTIFVKPTLEEVTSYIKEKNLLVSPVSFFEWYETAGWVDNKGKPIANWKLKLLSWNSREKEKNPQQSPENINKLIHDATREADAEELDFLFGATKNG